VKGYRKGEYFPGRSEPESTLCRSNWTAAGAIPHFFTQKEKYLKGIFAFNEQALTNGVGGGLWHVDCVRKVIVKIVC